VFGFLKRLVARREATPQDGLYGRSWKWSSVRATHLEREPRCIACGRDKGLEVHHVVPYHLDPSRELDASNLVTLCADPCHLVFGHCLSWRRWNPSVREDCGAFAKRLAEARAAEEAAR